MRIAIEGNLSPAGSYGIVNLNLGRALSRRGHQVAFIGFDLGHDDLAKLIADQSFEGLPVSAGEPENGADIRIRQIWPPVWTRRRREELLVVIQPWEFGSVPLSWIDGIANVDAVWVPSEYCKRGYIQSGVDPKKVWVVPNGFEPDEIVPLLPSRHPRTRLLFLGGTIFRKGIDVLVNALDTLDDAMLDSVDLVVKDVGADSFYINQSLLDDSLAAHSRVQARTTVEKRHLERGQLLQLIADSDALVQPYRAEGFGMPVLEAMALGTMVIHTKGGATNEFCGPGESLLVPSSLVTADQARAGDLLLADRCYWLEPSAEQLGQIIRDLIDGKIQSRPLVEAAKQKALGLSWANVGVIAEEALVGLSDGKVPNDSLSRLVADLSDLLESGIQRPAPLLSRLVAIGDLESAFRLASYLEDKSDLEERLEIAPARERLASVRQTNPDIWSGGPYRIAVAGAEFNKIEHFGYVHDFEGGDQATYAIAQYLSGYLAGCASVLDLGCGQGSMLRVLRSKGKSVQGVEADPALVGSLRADGFRIYQGLVPSDLDEFDISSFDGVFLGHIVEHLDALQFEQVLGWIYENIADNGVVLIQTPDFANPGVGSENFWLDSSHIRPYPIRLLKAMLSKSGFVPVEGGCRRIPEAAPLDVIALGRRIPRAFSTGGIKRMQAKGSTVIGHYALFSGISGFAQASRQLLDRAKLAEEGVEVRAISLDQAPGIQPMPLHPIVPLRFCEHATNDIALLDAPVGWLAEVSPQVRGRYKIARTTFEATPLPMSAQQALHSFDEIWCFSRYDAEIFANSGFPRESIFSIPPGIDVPEPENVRTLRTAMERKPFRFLSVFSFEPRKNPEALVKAFSTVAGEVSGCEMVVKLSGVTTQDFVSWLHSVLTAAEFAMIKDRMHVITDNLRSELLQRLYLESDVFVLPTRGEGYGLPYLEALAHGLATICPDVGGHREFCNEGNSLLVKSTCRPASLIPGSGIFRESFWREVDLEILTSKMIEAATHPELLRDLSEAGLVDAAGFGLAAYQTASRSRIAKIISEI